MSKHKSLFLFLSQLSFASIIVIVLFMVYKGVTVDNYSLYVTHFITLLSAILSAILIVVESISLSFDTTASKNTLFIAIFLLGFLLTSHDMVTALSIYYVFNYDLWLQIFHSFFFYLIAFSYFNFIIHDYCAPSKKISVIIALVLLTALTVDIFSLIFSFQWLSAIITFLLAYSLFAFISIKNNIRINLVYFLASGIFTSLIWGYFSHAITTSFISVSYCYGFESAIVLLVAFLFVSIYIVFIIKKTKEANEKEVYQRKIKDLQSTVLVDQINPHFIFNSLNLIKSNYHQNISDGDLAIDLFSKHLRNNVSVKGKTLLVPLTKELENVDCIIRLTNMQLKKDINVIYNIDYYDFCVPLLSIEPFVENVIKYARIEEIKDGFISISVAQKEDYYEIIIKDNGVGFDIAKISDKSQGIKNASERLQILVNATVEIISKINQGTSIIIKIPR